MRWFLLPPRGPRADETRFAEFPAVLTYHSSSSVLARNVKLSVRICHPPGPADARMDSSRELSVPRVVCSKEVESRPNRTTSLLAARGGNFSLNSQSSARYDSAAEAFAGERLPGWRLPRRTANNAPARRGAACRRAGEGESSRDDGEYNLTLARFAGARVGRSTGVLLRKCDFANRRRRQKRLS